MDLISFVLIRLVEVVFIVKMLLILLSIKLRNLFSNGTSNNKVHELEFNKRCEVLVNQNVETVDFEDVTRGLVVFARYSIHRRRVN